MGQLLALLRSPNEPALPPLASVNLIDPSPSAEEEKAIKPLRELLLRSAAVLQLLKGYQGCEEPIRAAISTPNPTNDAAAWEAVVPCVAKLRDVYEFAQQVEQTLPAVLAVFCAAGPGGVVDVQKNLETHQATAKAFADVLSLAWECDEAKMAKPAIQNDFSFYRRTVSRAKSHNATPGGAGGAAASPPPVSDEVANRMSLFYAYPAPMLKLITDKVANTVSGKPEAPSVASSLLLIATVCHNAVNTAANVPSLFALRCMTACLIIYDHIHAVGLYPKASEVNMKMFVKTIQAHGGSASDPLLTSLRFSTKTFNAPDVPKSTRALLDPNAA